ncbi:hypothetical protein FHU33_3132 [Blastococcus colisei]|uniref:Uncharacterized protein n=1 Tax=Blastococcus colisei TaxID=1564162 RepID=A0A543PHW3_9ACTN|nr:hypothetical protein [Blastococcus colisei]TQN43672.1 hypothetical protein FHU33_3132 [Blastococcus colisei]
MSDHQSHEEVAACLSPEGPTLVVALWLRAVFELARWDRAAAQCTPELRLAVAQAFVHRGLESGILPQGCSSDVADALAAGDTAQAQWPLFERSVLAHLAGYDVGRTGRFSVGSRPRVLDARHELVVVVPSAALTGPETHISGVGPAKELNSASASALPCWPLAVRRAPLLSPGWLVAGWRGRQLPQPGWPPVL